MVARLERQLRIDDASINTKANRSLETFNAFLPTLDCDGKKLSFLDVLSELPHGAKVLIYDYGTHHAVLEELAEHPKYSHLRVDHAADPAEASEKLEALNSYDVIASLHALKHNNTNPIAVWEAMYKALKVGGKLFIESIYLSNTPTARPPQDKRPVYATSTPLLSEAGTPLTLQKLQDWLTTNGYKATLSWISSASENYHLTIAMEKTNAKRTLALPLSFNQSVLHESGERHISYTFKPSENLQQEG